MFTPVFVLGSLVVLLILSGLLEFYFHQKVLLNIPIRIHVNGTRGKSSVTRLVAAGLREGGKKTFAKTTGTAPRVIDELGKDRIIHRLRKPSIGEQTRLLSYFANQQPDVVVIECMAVQPQYQWIAEHQMVKSHIGVITNARPDHLEEMGPTNQDVAKSLCNTVPVNGLLITAENEQTKILEEVASNNNSKIIFTDDSKITKSDVSGFKYLEHPQNISIALDVCEQLGVNRKLALEGMHKVQPDLGALIIWELFNNDCVLQFINGMAANDPVSTLQIWKFILDRYPARGTCVFFNSREDRPLRTKQMLELTFEEIKPDHLIVRGDKVDTVINHLKHYSEKTKVKIISLSESADNIARIITELPNDTLIYAIGNQVGEGQSILNKLSKFRKNG